MKDLRAVGIDAGSTAIKVAGVNEKGELIYSRVEPTSFRLRKQLNSILDEIPKDVPKVATGYGGELIDGALAVVSEIRCHALGAYYFVKNSCTVIDIGGQDSKVILVGNEGEVLDFVMNDKCAAGTGRFLENTAWRLEMTVEEMARLAASSKDEVPVSSVCAVFAESEVVSMIAKGKSMEAVVRGLHRALAKRVAALAKSLGIKPPVVLSGGVSKNPVLREMLEEELGEEVRVLPYPQFTGALGAALICLNSE